MNSWLFNSFQARSVLNARSKFKFLWSLKLRKEKLYNKFAQDKLVKKKDLLVQLNPFPSLYVPG